MAGGLNIGALMSNPAGIKVSFSGRAGCKKRDVAGRLTVPNPSSTLLSAAKGAIMNLAAEASARQLEEAPQLDMERGAYQIQVVRYFGKCPEVHNPDFAKFSLDEAAFVATIRSINAILEPHNEQAGMQADDARKAGQPSPAQAVRTRLRAGALNVVMPLGRMLPFFLFRFMQPPSRARQPFSLACLNSRFPIYLLFFFVLLSCFQATSVRIFRRTLAPGWRGRERGRRRWPRSEASSTNSRATTPRP